MAYQEDDHGNLIYIKNKKRRKEFCGNCKYFLRYENRLLKAGWCRRFPKTWKNNDEVKGWDFPEVSQVYDWCGEWKSKDE
jgi:hypothetical protein